MSIRKLYFVFFAFLAICANVHRIVKALAQRMSSQCMLSMVQRLNGILSLPNYLNNLY
jgi:hypothetical protein